MAGFTTVTGTIKDPFGTPYANGTWTANFVDPGTPGKTPLINGSIITRVYAGDLDSFGFFTVNLPDNAVIGTQTGAINTQWSFTFVNKSAPVGLGAPPGFTVGPLTITGASQDISAAAQAASAPITIPTAPLLAGNQTWTGINTFTGACSFTNVSSLNGIIFVDGVTYPRTSAGITSAITAALAASSAIVLSPGTYTISSTISISSGPLTIGCYGPTGQEQASPKPCVLNATAGLGANPIINISSADGTTLDNITLNNSGTATYGIFLQNTQYAWLNNLTCINPTNTFTTAAVGTATAGQANYQIHMLNPQIQATGPVGIQIDRTNIFSITHGAFINHTTANITVGLTTGNTQIIIDQGTDFGQAAGGGASAVGVKVGTVNGLHVKDSYCETAQSGTQTGQLCMQFVGTSQSTATLDSVYFAGNGVSNYGIQLNGNINLTLSGVNAFAGFQIAGVNNITNTSIIALGNNPVDTLNAVPVWDSLANVAFRQDAAVNASPFTINTGLTETGGMFVAQIGTPSAPTLSGPGSTGGSTTYTYFCVAEDASGLKTLASAAGQTTTGLATLTGVNFIAVHCPGQAGAYAYDILKTDTAHRLARVVVQYAGFGPTVNDTGQATVGFTAAGRDQTGDLAITGGRLSTAGGLQPAAAGAADVGSTGVPFGNLWLGTAATNNFKIQPASTTGARVITVTDPLSPTTVGLPLTIGSGTAAMTTAGIGTGACSATVTVAATGVLTTDIISVSRNAAATIGNGGGLTLNWWPTAGNVNFNYCNSSAGTITPTAMTVNWTVVR